MAGWLGLDIGGANLKAASPNGSALSKPFALWKHPDQLERELDSILKQFSFAGIAVTMTGELADRFESKQQGVEFIVDAVSNAARGTAVRFYQTSGRLVSAHAARKHWLATAASNWHATAHWLATTSKGSGFLVDVGSTTTDIIPIEQGRVATEALTDLDRLAQRQLVYLGADRTPLCALVQQLQTQTGTTGVANELFSTVADVFLVLGEQPDQPENCQTADGRPRTQADARRRLAKMVCSEPGELGEESLWMLAVQLRQQLKRSVADAIEFVCDANPQIQRQFWIIGQGGWLAREIVQEVYGKESMVADDGLSPLQSVCGPAVAVAELAKTLEPDA